MKKHILAIAIILGLGIYPLLPEDTHVDVPDGNPRVIAETKEFFYEEPRCIHYQKYLIVDGARHMTGKEKVVCK